MGVRLLSAPSGTFDVRRVLVLVVAIVIYANLASSRERQRDTNRENPPTDHRTDWAGFLIKTS